MRWSLAVLTFCAGALSGVAAARAPALISRDDRVEVELTGAGWPLSTRVKKRLDPMRAPQHRSAAGGSRSVSPRDIANRALDFTVFIRGGPVYGAGVVIDAAGHVLTCDHVIDGVPKISVYFHEDPRPVPAKVIGRDKQLDLALLAIDAVPAAVAPIGSVVDSQMGDAVFAMGAPRKMSFSFSRGVVSYVGRSFDGTLYLQTDLPANSGSSGGPVLNDRGELIGLSSFILRGSQGLAFAVPVDYAFVRFASALSASRSAERFRGWLAARQRTEDGATSPPVPTADSPAQASSAGGAGQ